MRKKVSIIFFLLIGLFLFAICGIPCEASEIDNGFNYEDYQKDEKTKEMKSKRNIILTENVDFNDENETFQFCNEFMNIVNENLNYYDTSIEKELNKKIDFYENALKKFELNEKNIEEYQELVAKLDNYQEILNNYNNILYATSNNILYATSHGIIL
ncbi:MAG: hypothetical protein MR357_00695 [Anaeroplasma sp.]|nr:hypothetical protein [Anaeroplasma sp.]